MTVDVMDAFIDGQEGGNPAGVVLDADGLSTEEKQEVAAGLGASETAFVSRSTAAGFKLDFVLTVRLMMSGDRITAVRVGGRARHRDTRTITL